MDLQDAQFHSPAASPLFDLRQGVRTFSGMNRVIGLRAPGGAGRRAGWGVVAALLLFATAHLLVRGPIDLKGNVNLCDFAIHYSTARMWLIGGNPYEPEGLTVVWQASAPGAFQVPMIEWWSLLPPGAYVVLAPIAALPAWAAGLTWLALSGAAIAGSLAAALWIARIRAGSLAGMLLISGALAAAPFQTLLAVGQVSLFAVALILLSMACAQRGRDAWAGALLGVAACLKPQLAVPFGIFYLAYRNWRLAAFAAVTALGVNLLGIAPLEWRGHPWWSDWTANIAASTAAGAANDMTFTSPWRHQIVNLSVLLYALTGSKVAVTVLNALIAAALISAYAYLVRRARLSADSLLSLGILCSLAILPVYHRSYDAAVLVIPFAWALTALRGPLRIPARVTLAALALFLIPFDALVVAERKLGLFAGLSQTWAWRALVAPHHAWAALAACAALLAALYLRVRQMGAVHDTQDEGEIISLLAYQRASETADRWRTARSVQTERARRTG